MKRWECEEHINSTFIALRRPVVKYKMIIYLALFTA